MLGDLDGKFGRTLKMVVVVVAFVFSQHGVPLSPQRRHVDFVHRVKVGGVKARAKQRLLFGLQCC